MNGEAQPSRLARKLTLADAVVIGLGAMVGAGVFSAFGPAAAAAGAGLLYGLVLAGLVAYFNAMSSSALAALYPQAGGTYVYARERLGPSWGFLAGWAFVAGKSASCAAMALTFGHYAAPGAPRLTGAAAVAAVTAATYRGIERTARLTRAVVLLVMTALALVVVGSLAGGQADPSRLVAPGGLSAAGVVRAAGFAFFAFAGYARIATLGEEVVDPARVIPRAIRSALFVALAVYALVAVSALAALGPEGLAGSDAPLVAAVRAGRLGWVAPAVQAGAAVASLGVLLSLLAGLSRTIFAMAANGDLPRGLAAVHPRHRVPHRAELWIGAVVAATALLWDLRGAIGFSAFGVLCYYALANASAWTLRPGQAGGGRIARVRAALGVAGCVGLALGLPPPSVAAGVGILAAGVLARAVAGKRAGAHRAGP